MKLATEGLQAYARAVKEGTAVASAMPVGSADFVAEAVAGAGIGTWHLDIEAGVTTWDGVASEILGYEPEPRTTQGSGAVHPDDQHLLHEELSKHLREGGGYNVQFRIIRADGETRWLHASAGAPKSVSGRPRYLAGIVGDITARKNADEQLRQAEERHLLISRASTDLVYEWDIASGHLEWNEALVNHFGHDPARLASVTELHLLLHPDEREELAAKISEVLESGGMQFNGEHRFQRGDQSYAHVQTCIQIIRDSDGNPVRVIGNFHDVSERVQLDAALRESEAVNRSIVDASADVIKLLNLDGTMLFINGSGLDAFEANEQSIPLGEHWPSLWPDSAQGVVREAVAAAGRGEVARFSEAFPTPAGEHRWWDVVVSPVIGRGGKPTKLVVVSRDITERNQASERLQWGANHDSLTGLPNRAFFQEALANAVVRARASRRNLGLMLFDLDDFKQVNDAHGHDAGDAVLKTFASRLANVLAGNATLARLGGDEFAALIEEPADENELLAQAESILLCMREPFLHAARILDCHVTIGAALLSDYDKTAEDLLKNADIALYVAKGSNRGSPTLFQPSHRDEMQQRLAMVSLARKAVSEHRIVPFYQPKVTLPDGNVHGFEALLRWRHSSGQIQLPATISAAFEDLDVAAAISNDIVDQVISDMSDWLHLGFDFGHVAVNAAVAEFRRDNFAESVLERLERSGVPPRYFQLEVTETVFLGRGAEYVDRALKLLDSAGVSIALDDFGTGYASLRHLKQFPVHVIKIDQSFVRDMGNDADEEAIISAVLNLGRSLKIEVVAEGIETQAQAHRLRELGCKYGQGFLFSPAVSAADVRDMLRSGQKTALEGSWRGKLRSA